MPRTDLEQIVYQMSADVQQLTKQNERALAIVKTKTREMQHEYDKVDPGKALEKVFSRARLSVIEEGGAKIGIFGSAIEELGVAGIAGAAGIAALAISFERAHAAAEWADSVEKAGIKIGITTREVQEFDHVASAADIPIDVFREALSKANSVLGAFQSNVGDARAKKAFAALGITKEEARGWDNIADALPLITERIGKLGSVAEKTKIADAMGLGDLLPVILKGRDNLQELIAEAHKYGLVINEDVIKTSAEAADKMKVAAEIADKSLKSAFIDLAPAAADLAMALAGVVHQLTEMASKSPDAVRGIQDIMKRKPGGGEPEGWQGKIQSLMPLEGEILKNINLLHWAGVAYDALAKRGREAKLSQSVADFMAGGKVDVSGMAPDPKAKASALIPEQGKTVSDHTAQATAKAQQALDEATRELVAAWGGLTEEIAAHAQLERDGIDAELKKKNDQLDAEATKIAADKDIGAVKKKELVRQIEVAEALNVEAADAKKAKVTRDEDLAIAEHTLSLREQVDGYYSDMARIAASMAHSSAERRDIELKNLASEQELARTRKKMELNKAVASGNTSQEDADHQLGVFKDDQAAQVSAVMRNTQGPIEAYIDSLKNIDDLIQGDAVNAFRSLADSIGDTTAKLLHLKGPFGQFVGQILSLMVQRQGSGLLGLLHIPGFASGTSSAPGGLAIIGENGPELMNVPRGAQIMPNGLLQSLQGGLSIGGGGGRLDYHVHIDLTGANGDQTIRKIAYEASAQGAAMAYGAATKDIPARMNSRAANRLGR